MDGDGRRGAADRGAIDLLPEHGAAGLVPLLAARFLLRPDHRYGGVRRHRRHRRDGLRRLRKRHLPQDEQRRRHQKNHHGRHHQAECPRLQNPVCQGLRGQGRRQNRRRIGHFHRPWRPAGRGRRQHPGVRERQDLLCQKQRYLPKVHFHPQRGEKRDHQGQQHHPAHRRAEILCGFPGHHRRHPGGLQLRL